MQEDRQKNIYQSLYLTQNAASFIYRVKKKIPTPSPLNNLVSEYKTINPYNYDLSNQINWNAFSNFILNHYNGSRTNKQITSSQTLGKHLGISHQKRIILKSDRSKSLSEAFRYYDISGKIPLRSIQFNLRPPSQFSSQDQQNKKIQDSTKKAQVILKNRRKSCEGELYGKRSQKVLKLDLVSGTTFIQQKIFEKRKQIEELTGDYRRLPFKLIIRTKKLTKRLAKNSKQSQIKNRIKYKKSKSVIPFHSNLHQVAKASLSFDDKSAITEIPQINHLSDEIIDKIQWVMKSTNNLFIAKGKIKKELRYGKTLREGSHIRLKYYRNGKWNFRFNSKDEPPLYYFFQREFIEENQPKMKNKINFTLLRKYLPKYGPIQNKIKNYSSTQDITSLKASPKITLHQTTTRIKTGESDNDDMIKSHAQKIIYNCISERKQTDPYAIGFTQRFPQFELNNSKKNNPKQPFAPYYEGYNEVRTKKKSNYLIKNQKNHEQK